MRSLQQVTSEDNGYNHLWVHETDYTHLSFRVAACSDAHLVLTPTIKDTSRAFEVRKGVGVGDEGGGKGVLDGR